MAKKKSNDKLNYQLTKGRRPAAWQLPTRNLMLEKTENGRSLGKRKVEWIPGNPSIFKEDHKGDEEPKDIWFEDGVLQVDPGDIAKAEILKKHPWNGIHFELVDEDVEATKNLDKMELRIKAYEAVSSKNTDEMRARAFVLCGAGVMRQSDKVVESTLKQMAFQEPETVLGELKNPDYAPKTVAALAVLRNVLILNPTNTQVSWADTGNHVVSVASGQDPITKLGQFLSGKDENAKITLQVIDEKIKRSYEFKDDYTASKEIKSIAQNQDDDKDDVDLDLEEARADYEALFDKSVPNNKKNDLEWIKEKIKEEEESD